MSARELQTLSIVEARDRLTRLPEELERIVKEGKSAPAVKVTRRNKPVLAILPWDLYESLMETVEVLSDDDQTAALRHALQEVAEGQTKPWHAVLDDLDLNTSDAPAAVRRSVE